MTKIVTQMEDFSAFVIKEGAKSGTVPGVILLDPGTGDPYGGTHPIQFVNTIFKVTTGFTGASIGDELCFTQEYNISGSPATLVSGTWRNLTTAAALSSPPSGTNILYAGAIGLTDAQVRATALPVSLPTTPTANLATIAAEVITSDATLTTIEADLQTLITDVLLQPVKTQLPATLGSKASASALGVALSTEEKASLAAMLAALDLLALKTQLPASLGNKAKAAALAVGLSTEDKTALDLIGTQTAPLSYAKISTASSTQVKGSAGFLGSIVLNSKGTVASTITIYDALSAIGTPIAIIDSLNPLGNQFNFNVALTTGLFIVVTGTLPPNLTVCYK